MGDMTIDSNFPAAAEAVSVVIAGAEDVPLDRPTPCRDFDLRSLVNHFVGTTHALARLGRGEELDPTDPYGAKNDPAQGDWRSELDHGVRELAEAWGRPESWEGSIDMGGSAMPAVMIGEMAMAELVLHGWDLARATGQSLTIPDEEAAELRRSIEETGELGRQMGAYGPVVEVAAAATELERALGASGRDPRWCAGRFSGASDLVAE
jgi:uncharacterized protein (TIGR03086 family)